MGVDTGFVVQCGSEKLSRNRAITFKMVMLCTFCQILIARRWYNASGICKMTVSAIFLIAFLVLRPTMLTMLILR
jgi:hypothetical protein